MGTKNICGVYGVPGIPRFEASGLPVISELTNEFTNAAVTAKSDNCIFRSALNFATALTWTYGNGDGKDAAHYKGSTTKGRLQSPSTNRKSRLKIRK